MKILMVAPEPFFRIRGTPFSIRQRLEAFSQLGYKVDLLTYPLGDEVNLAGLRIFRSFRPFWIKDVKIGPSWNKIPLDFFLFLKAIWFVYRGDYDCIHSHEEAGFLGALLKRIFGLFHMYDMHSSLPEQLVNYKFIASPFLLNLAKIAEGWLLKNSSAVIAICPYLKNWAGERVNKEKIFLIENLPLTEAQSAPPPESIELLEKLKEKGNKIVLYTGNLQYNQGIDLLIEAARLVIKNYPRVKFVIVGGKKENVDKFRQLAQGSGLINEIVFTGEKAIGEMPVFMKHADILVSPRRIGNNTPLKIYSYLFSGKPMIATNIFSHTQILNDEIALLTEVDGQGIAKGILRILEDGNLGENLAKKAREFALKRFNQKQYLGQIKNVYSLVKEER